MTEIALGLRIAVEVTTKNISPIVCVRHTLLHYTFLWHIVLFHACCISHIYHIVEKLSNISDEVIRTQQLNMQYDSIKVYKGNSSVTA